MLQLFYFVARPAESLENAGRDLSDYPAALDHRGRFFPLMVASSSDKSRMARNRRTSARSPYPILTSCARSLKDCDAYCLHWDRKWT